MDTKMTIMDSRITEVENRSTELQSLAESIVGTHNAFASRIEDEVQRLDQQANRRHEAATARDLKHQKHIQNTVNELRDTKKKLADLEAQMRILYNTVTARDAVAEQQPQQCAQPAP